MATESVFRIPSNAWPTIAVAGISILGVALAVAYAHAGVIPMALGAPIAFVCAFAAFTPMHDASHRSVSRNVLVNEIVGRLMSLVLAAPFSAFRHVHLEHHKHTNDEELDPDHYSGRGPRWTLPLRWLTQDLHYDVVVVRSWGQFSRSARFEIVVNFAVLIGLIAGLSAAGFGSAVLFCWLLPARLAIGALSFSFDYLPHVPHRTKAADDRYEATRILLAPGLTTLFLYQNYHLIHHLYPGVPFYRYQKIFAQRKDKLLARGAIVSRWPREANQF